MPVFAGAVLDPAFIQVIGNPLRSKPALGGKLEYETDYFGLRLSDCQIIDLLAALVLSSALDKVVPIGAGAACKASVLCQKAHAVGRADRGLFTLAVGLPKADVVRQLVRVIIKALFALLGAPDADAIFARTTPPQRAFHRRYGLFGQT